MFNYIELLIKLLVKTKYNGYIPTETRIKASKLIVELFELLFPYSD